MSRDFPFAPAAGLREQASGWLAGSAERVPARLAATVMCLRDRPGGLEVFTVHRASTMAFAPSMHVFPGGGVDPRDADDLPWFGPSPQDWAGLLHTDVEPARMLVAAAVREVFEETGVLLAGPGPEALARPSASWLTDRRALVDRTLGFGELLRRDGLVLRADLLSYRAHWTTPVFEPKRYDTRFFAAAIPAGQEADDQSDEAQSADWSQPGDLLRAYADGRVNLLPPTIVMLEELAEAQTVADVLVSRTDVAEVMPRLVEDNGELTMRVDLPPRGGRP